MDSLHCESRLRTKLLRRHAAGAEHCRLPENTGRSKRGQTETRLREIAEIRGLCRPQRPPGTGDYFDDVANGIKTFELRKNDRGYKKGDILEMMEFADGKNTGRMVKVLVTYILEDYTGIEDGYCIMATKLMKDGEE